MSKQHENTKDPELSRKLLDAQNGDQAAFEELLTRYMPLIRSLSVRFSRTRERTDDREDLEQTAIIAFLHAVERYDATRSDSASFGTYAAYCIKNAIVSELRSIKKWDHTILLEDEELADAEDTEGDPASKMIEEEDYLALTESIRRALSPYENRIWWLYLSGRTAKEIAVQMEKDEKSVHNAIFRIRRKLRAIIPTP
jgi:RNA polymerase sporulation-specific sigma factor